MPGCGYICPKCNDTGFDEDSRPCDWCKPLITSSKAEKEISEEEWINKVHEGSCCGDLGQKLIFQ